MQARKISRKKNSFWEDGNFSINPILIFKACLYSVQIKADMKLICFLPIHQARYLVKSRCSGNTGGTIANRLKHASEISIYCLRIYFDYKRVRDIDSICNGKERKLSGLWLGKGDGFVCQGTWIILTQIKIAPHRIESLMNRKDASLFHLKFLF